MAASKAIGFLNFKFGADLSGFERAMKKAQKGLKKFGKSVEATGRNMTFGLTVPILSMGNLDLIYKKLILNLIKSLLAFKHKHKQQQKCFKILLDFLNWQPNNYFLILVIY